MQCFIAIRKYDIRQNLEHLRGPNWYSKDSIADFAAALYAIAKWPENPLKKLLKPWSMICVVSITIYMYYVYIIM